MDENQKKALAAALGQIERQFGKGAVMRMGEIEKPGEWTEMRVIDVEFDIDIPSNTFTLSNLRNPRR